MLWVLNGGNLGPSPCTRSPPGPHEGMRDFVGRRPPLPGTALVELPGYYSRQLSGPPPEHESSQRPSPPQSPSLITCLVVYDA